MSIIQTLVEMETSYSVEKDKSSKEMKDEYANRVCKAIKDHAYEISGKKKQIHADPAIMRVALANFLQSSSGYERLKANSLEIYPSASIFNEKIRVGIVAES